MLLMALSRQSIGTSSMKLVKEALPQADILIYEEEGTVLGFLGLQDSYIAGLFVEKASRSRGIGRLLLEAAKSGRQELTLHAYAENTGAVRFYEREGFQTAAFEKEETTGREGCFDALDKRRRRKTDL